MCYKLRLLLRLDEQGGSFLKQTSGVSSHIHGWEESKGKLKGRDFTYEPDAENRVAYCGWSKLRLVDAAPQPLGSWKITRDQV